VVTGVRYSFTGALTAPRQVLDGGYLTWPEPVSGHWFQQRVTNGTAQIKHLGPIQPGANSLRFMIDSRTPRLEQLSRLDSHARSFQEAMQRRERSDRAKVKRADDLRSQLSDIRDGKAKE
jgi:hypothetical protein